MIRAALVLFTGAVLAFVVFFVLLLGQESGVLDVTDETFEMFLAGMLVCIVFGLVAMVLHVIWLAW
jgi:MFS-type transporter involved in bile tolerance (Atg22 family)